MGFSWHCLNKQRICPYRFRFVWGNAPETPTERDECFEKRNCRVEVCFTKGMSCPCSPKRQRKPVCPSAALFATALPTRKLGKHHRLIFLCCFCHAAGGVQSGSGLEEIQFHKCSGYASVQKGLGGHPEPPQKWCLMRTPPNISNGGYINLAH